MRPAVSRHWVVNASPIILLAKVSLVSMLDLLCDDLVVPSGVVRELEQGPEDDPAREWLTRAVGNRKIEPTTLDTVVTSWDLGRGETEVISFAYQHPGFEAVVDDRAARTCASALGVPVRGTLAVLLLAKKEGHLDRIGPALTQLTSAGLYLDESLSRTALKLAGEAE